MFRVLCVDPPWKFKDKLPGDNRGAEKNYPCLTRRELMRFPLPSLADDCVLLMWRVAAMQQDALDVVDAWGFAPKSEIVWLKKTANGERWFGMGRTVRAEHEICIVATKGRPEVLSHSTRSTFVTDVAGLSAKAGRHSEKPEEFYKIVEGLFPGPYCELFARRERPGWTTFGNELKQAHPWTDADVVQALRNSGVDTECGACMEVAFTGLTLSAHTCASYKLPLVEVTE